MIGSAVVPILATAAVVNAGSADVAVVVMGCVLLVVFNALLIAAGWSLIKKAAASLIRAVDWMTRHEKRRG